MKEFLRQMEASDVKEGKTFYLLGDFNIIYKGKVERVLHPNDPFKAFCADDGCRYGLETSYVKIKKSEV